MKSKQEQKFKVTEIGKIPIDWDTDKLENHLIIKGRIGWKGLKTSEYTESGPYIVTGIQIKEKRVSWEECSHITEERYLESPEIMLHEEDILMTKDGTIGKLAFIEKINHKATVASHIHVIRKNSEKIIPKFLFYAFQSTQFKNLIESKISGSVVPALTQKDINGTIFPIPPIKEQIFIAKIFYELDSKIRTLRNQNKILEQIAQTIFKSWFVDFDGVTEFEDSELGQIPKGWKISSIAKECNKINYGFTQSSVEKPIGPHFLRITDIGKDFLNWEEVPYCEINSKDFERYQLFDGDIVIARTGANTGINKLITLPPKSVFASYLIRLKPKSSCFSEYISSFLQSSMYKNYIHSVLGEKSAQPNANAKTLTEIEILIPEQKIFERFGIISKSIHTCIEKNNYQISKLISIRDNLLPKLMSGEIRV